MSNCAPRAGGVFQRHTTAVFMVVTLLFVAWQAVENGMRFRTYFSSSAQAENVTDEIVFRCMEELFRNEVPAKSSVWVEEPDSLWQQRLAEFSVPWAHLAAELADAELVVSLGSAVNPAAPNCFGLTVIAERQ